MKYYVKSAELFHYGVPGMKWGKRKAIQKMSRYERKYQRYQDQADMANLKKSAALDASHLTKTAGAKLNGVASKVNKAGAQLSPNGALSRATEMAGRRVSRAVSRRAVRVAINSGKQAAKAQAKADKWKKKLDRVAQKKNIDLGKGTVDDYLLRSMGGK